MSLLARGCPGFETLRASEGRGALSDEDERKLSMKRLRNVVVLVDDDPAEVEPDAVQDVSERAGASAIPK